MKKLIIAVCTVSTLLIAQNDAAGNYKLSGLDVQYYMAARYDTPLYVTDIYGAGLTISVAVIQAGELFYAVRNGPLNEAALTAINVNLNVLLNEDGTGALLEGSAYPDQELIEGTCISEIQILPITDDIIYQSNGALPLVNPGVNVIGLPGITQYAGETFGGLGLSQSVVFDYFPMIPEQPTLCDSYGNCFPLCYPDGSLTGGNLDGECDFYPAGAPMLGAQAGFFWKEGVNGPADIEPTIPGNTDPQFYLEWHAIDGAASESGLGDIIGDDEDGDGTDFDRILGLPYITATLTNPACGFNYPIFGDVTAYLPEGCATGVDVANDAYVLDPALGAWGGFLTFNAAMYLATGDPSWTQTNDGDHDYNGVDGRMVMNFEPTCVPEVEIREVAAEFIDVAAGDCDLGDMNASGGIDVTDILALVSCILAQSCANGDASACAGDLNSDGSYNIFDILALVEMILGRVSVDNATSAEFNVRDNEVTMTANGYVGAVQITLTHGNEFQINLTDDALIAEYLTEGNTTRLMIVEPTGNSLFTTSNDFTIESVIAVSNSESYMQTSVNMLKDYRISSAYPNPFNPSTQMTLDLNTDANVSVKIYNTMGQLVDVIADGNMVKGSYSLSWNGTNAASGVYFIKTEIGEDILNQKIMLIK